VTSESVRGHGIYEELKLVLAPETELVAIQPLADEVSRDFLRISIEKQTFGVAAGGPGFEYLEIGLIIVVSAAAYEFIKSMASEAGRDAYRAVREALGRTYRMLPIQTDRGKFHPLAFQLELDDPPRRLMYRFREGMMSHQIAKALELIMEDAKGRLESAELLFDAKSLQWKTLPPLS